MSNRHKSIAVSQLLLAPLAIVCTLSSMHAQSNYGAVRGVVSDVNGAILGKANVTLVDVGTKLERTTTTNGAGEYVFNVVDPGTYNVVVAADGFSRYEKTRVIVDTGNTIPVDVKMVVGSSNVTVEVTAQESLVDNGTSYNGQLIDSQKLLNLPNPGRNPFLFSKLDNNVVPVGDPRFVRFQDQSGSSQISIAGAPTSSNNYLIDGIPITDFSNRAVIIPTLEATDNVKVQSNTYDAEIGRTSGGNFNTTLRSGTSALHGVLQGETRQTNWGANLWFNNRTNTPRPPAEFYSYVGAIGGPIPMPNVRFLGGNESKTFFWIAEEGYRQRSPLTGVTVAVGVPTAKMRTGDFSEMLSFATPRIIYNPATSRLVNGAVVRDPYANNIIPTSQINKVGSALINAYPAANAAKASYDAQNFQGGDVLADRADEFVGKLDHNFGTRWASEVYYMHYGSKEPGGNFLQTFAGSSNSYYLLRKVDAIGVQNVITLNPTTVLTVGFGFNRFPNNTLDVSQGFDQTTLGLPSSYVSALKKSGFPRITTSNTAVLSNQGTSNSGPAVYFSRNFVVGVAKSLGKHSVKVGYVYRKISLAYTSLSDASGQFGFTNTFTSANNTASTSSGSDVADMLLGLPTSGQVLTPTPFSVTAAYHAGYIQDDFRLTPKITLNLGVRYEFENGIRERSNNYAVGFDRTVVNPLSATSGVQTLGGIEFAGQNSYKSNTGDMGSKFAPRGGIAIQLTPNTVLKGGIGLFYPPLVYTALQTPGYTGTSSFTTNSVNGLPGNSLSNPYPSGVVAPSGNTNGYLTNVGSAITVIDQSRKAPSFRSYSLDIEHQFPLGFAMRIGYVGGHGNNFSNTININQLSTVNLALGASALNTAVANPYYQKGGLAAIGNATVPRYQLLRPFPAFGNVSALVSNGVSDYNSLALKVQKRMSFGLTVLAGYTWSSNWDNLWGASNALNSGNNGPQDINDLSKEYSRAINNTPNRATFATTYELPFGKGKRYLAGANRVVDLLVGGWHFNDITILQNGMPLAITQANNNSTYGFSATRPSLVSGVSPCKSGRPEDRLSSANPYFNASAFTVNAAGSLGSLPRTSNCYGPGYINSDLSLNKNFRVTERVNAEFRAEALNAFNTPQFQTPNLTVASGSTSVGTITGTNGFPRLVQLGGRITF